MFAILFLLTYLFSTTEFYQLLKIPVLVVHFFEHKELDPEMSVIGFFVHHYEGNHLENHPQNEDFEQDKRLPFMTHIDLFSFCCEYTPPYYQIIRQKVPHIAKLKIPVPNDYFTESLFHSSIWQPPRAC